MNSNIISLTRDKSIDNAKFILIFLVFLGHALELTRDVNIVSEKIYTFIYSFHMPAFIIISGYFYAFSREKKFWAGIIDLCLLYFFFQLALCGNPLKYTCNEPYLQQVLCGVKHNIEFFYMPSGALWYVVSLIFWRIIMHYLVSLNKIEPNWKILIFTVFMSLLAGFVPLNYELSFQRTFSFFPYFVFGYMVAKNDLSKLFKQIPLSLAIVVVCVYGVIISYVKHIPLSMLEGSFSYYEFGNLTACIASRLTSYIWMLPLTLSCLRIFCQYKIFSAQGKNSMFFYIYHMYMIAIIRHLFISSRITYINNSGGG